VALSSVLITYSLEEVLDWDVDVWSGECGRKGVDVNEQNNIIQRDWGRYRCPILHTPVVNSVVVFDVELPVVLLPSVLFRHLDVLEFIL